MFVCRWGGGVDGREEREVTVVADDKNPTTYFEQHARVVILTVVTEAVVISVQHFTSTGSQNDCELNND